MSNDLAKLVVRLEAENSRLHTELDRSKKKMGGFRKKMKVDINAIGKYFVGLSVIGGAALTALYSKNASAIDGLVKQSDKLGIMTNRLQGLRHAGRLTGVDFKTMDMAIQRSTRRIAEAAKGTGEARAALAELNLDVEQLSKLSPDQQFYALAEAMKGVESQSDKVRLAMKLFDSEGVALVNTMALGKEGLQAAQDEIDGFGVAISRVDAAKIEAANDEFYKANLLSSQFGQRLAVETAPIVAGLANEFIFASKESGGMGVTARNAVDSIATGAGVAADAVRLITIAAYGAVVAFRELINAQIQVGTAAGRAGRWWSDLLGIDKNAMHGIAEFADDFQAQTDRLSKGLADLTNEPMPSAKLKEWMTKNRDAAEQAAQEVAKEREGNLGGMLLGDISGDGTGKLGKTKAQADKDLESLLTQLMTEEERIQQSYDKRLEIINNAKKHELIGETRHEELKQKLQKKRDLDLLKAENKIAIARIQVQKNILDVGIAIAKDGSKAERALLAIKKVVALRESMLNLKVAMSEAMAQPWPTNVGAIATVATIGAGIITDLKGIDTSVPSYSGGGFTGSGPRLGGIDGQGGFLAINHPQETIVDHAKGQGMGGVQVNLIEDAANAGQVTQSQNGDMQQIDIAVATLFDQGNNRTTRSLERRYPNNRRAGS